MEALELQEAQEGGGGLVGREGRFRATLLVQAGHEGRGDHLGPNHPRDRGPLSGARVVVKVVDRSMEVSSRCRSSPGVRSPGPAAGSTPDHRRRPFWWMGSES